MPLFPPLEVKVGVVMEFWVEVGAGVDGVEAVAVGFWGPEVSKRFRRLGDC